MTCQILEEEVLTSFFISLELNSTTLYYFLVSHTRLKFLMTQDMDNSNIQEAAKKDGEVQSKVERFLIKCTKLF